MGYTLALNVTWEHTNGYILALNVTWEHTNGYISALDVLCRNTRMATCDRCDRLKCPLAQMSGLQFYNMGYNGHGLNMYGVLMIIINMQRENMTGVVV